MHRERIKLIVFNLVFMIVMITQSVSAFENQIQADTTAIKALLEKVEEDISDGNLVTAKRNTIKAGKMAEDIGYLYGIQYSLLNLGDIYLNEQFFDSAETVLTQTLEKYPDSKLKVHLQNLLASAYRYQNQNDKAIRLYEQILTETDSTTRPRLIAAVRQNLAVAYNNEGKKAEAIANFLEGLNYAVAEKDTLFLVTVLNNIGDVYNEYSDFERAEYYLEKSIEISAEKNIQLTLLRSTMNLGISKMNLDKTQEALDLFSDALDLHKQLRPNTPPFQILYNIGNLHLKTGNLEKAELNFRESLNYSEQYSISPGIYFNSEGLGLIAMEREDYNEAKKWFKRTLELGRLLNSPTYISASFQKLYEAHKALGEFESSLNYFEKYETLSDSLHTLQKEREFSELENSLELARQNEINDLLTEKQQQQEKQLQFQLFIIIGSVLLLILVLYILYTARKTNRIKTATNKKLRTQQVQLEKMNAQMNKLFAIIAHDLRSPMSTMKGLIMLFREGNLSPEEKQKFLDQVEESIESNILVMEDLFTWAKHQMSGIELSLSPVNVNKIVVDVIKGQKTEAELKRIKIINDMDPQLANISGNVNALTLIFRNLLTNSIKFTDEGGQIRFYSKETDGRIMVCVSDTGVGMSEEVQEKVFRNNSISYSSDGTKGEKGTGFGISLVKEFIQKLNGILVVESKIGKGTIFCLKFDKA